MSVNVFFTKWSEVEGRIDPSQYHEERLSAISRLKKSGRKLQPLKHIANFNKEITTSNCDNLPYIGLENIESDTGIYIKTSEKETFGTALKFSCGQVLFPKLRPYLNKVYLAEFDGLCSTEFHLLNSKEVSNAYLSIFLRSSIVVSQTKHLMTGNTLPRLQTEDIENLLIPMLSSEEQANIIKKMDEAYRQKEANEAKADRLLNSIDEYLLGELGIKMPEIDDKDISKRIFTRKISDISGDRFDAQYYKTRHQYGNLRVLKSLVDIKGGKRIPKGLTFSFEPTNYSYLRVEDIDSFGYVNYDRLKHIDSTVFNILKNYELNKNDIILSIAGTIGKVSLFESTIKSIILTENCAKLIIKDNMILPEYLNIILQTDFVQNQFHSNVIQTTIPKLGLERIANLKIPLPSIEKQNEIAEHIKSIRNEVKRLKDEAKAHFEATKAEVEKMILGESSEP